MKVFNVTLIGNDVAVSKMDTGVIVDCLIVDLYVTRKGITKNFIVEIYVEGVMPYSDEVFMTVIIVDVATLVVDTIKVIIHVTFRRQI